MYMYIHEIAMGTWIQRVYSTYPFSPGEWQASGDRLCDASSLYSLPQYVFCSLGIWPLFIHSQWQTSGASSVTFSGVNNKPLFIHSQWDISGSPLNI